MMNGTCFLCIKDLLREFIRYASEHHRFMLGIVAVLMLISILSSREQNRIWLFLYALVVAYMTLLNRKYWARRANLIPFSSYRLFFVSAYFRRQILNNIFLFIPLGTILSRLRPKWSTALILVQISIGVELLQLLTARGLLETDDVISNSIGGLIGLTAGLLCMYVSSFFRKRDQ